MTTDPRIAVLSALSSPDWHPIPEAHGMPWDEAEQLLAAYDASRAAVSAVAPATDRAALRDRIAAAIWERQNPGRRWADCEYRWRADAEADADAVLSVLPATVDRAAVLREAEDVLRARAKRMTGEFNDSDVLHEDGPAATVATWKRAADLLRHMADETQQPEDEPTESVIYEVVGDWGVDSADSAEGARAAVAKWLRAYPKCGAFAQQRIVRDWPDGSEFYGPWTDIPAAEPATGAQQPKEA